MVSDRDPLLRYDPQPRINSKINLRNYQNPRALHPELLQNQLQESKQSINITSSNWESTLEKCIKSIVSIKSCQTRGLDTEVPGSFTASGFIVDSKFGIILSNRHVVSISPIKAYAVLCNYEEIELKPIYRDPVHDFGFFQYDPCQIRFLDIPGIELYPKGAKIGQDIRVVG
jgi:S1-C subfamily serine protease